MSEAYWIRKLLVDALIQATPKEPDTCKKCDWPTGGGGKKPYRCLCESGYAVPGPKKGQPRAGAQR